MQKHILIEHLYMEYSPIQWFLHIYFKAHNYNNKQINDSLLTDERNTKIISAVNSISNKCLKSSSSSFPQS